MNRLGEKRMSNEGYPIEIVGYHNSQKVDVLINNDIVKVVQYIQFKNGEVRYPLHRSIFSIGYIGVGEYMPTRNGKITKQYDTWRGMLRRCYDPKTHQKRPTYIGCEVCEEWHNFQNFAKWFDENYYEIEGEQMHLDKDILVKGNKIYSPETCVFVPRGINTMFTKNDSKRNGLPIGVSKNGKTNKFRVMLGKKKVCVTDTVEEAFTMYKQAKEDSIKQMAEQYKEVIPNTLYRAMIRYKVEISD